MVSAYEALKLSHPDKVFKYAETGKKNGGVFKPHKTHQNGLPIDIMTPMKNSKGKSVHLPTHVFNRLGYDIELDSKNRSWVRHDDHYHVDFEVACETG